MSLEEQKEKFRTVAKRILKENLSTNVETLDRYKVDITNEYNDFIDFCAHKIIQLKDTEEELQDVYIDAAIQVRKRLIQSLNLNIDLRINSVNGSIFLN